MLEWQAYRTNRIFLGHIAFCCVMESMWLSDCWVSWMRRRESTRSCWGAPSAGSRTRSMRWGLQQLPLEARSSTAGVWVISWWCLTWRHHLMWYLFASFTSVWACEASGVLCTIEKKISFRIKGISEKYCSLAFLKVKLGREANGWKQTPGVFSLVWHWCDTGVQKPAHPVLQAPSQKLTNICWCDSGDQHNLEILVNSWLPTSLLPVCPIFWSDQIKRKFRVNICQWQPGMFAFVEYAGAQLVGEQTSLVWITSVLGEPRDEFSCLLLWLGHTSAPSCGVSAWLVCVPVRDPQRVRWCALNSLLFAKWLGGIPEEVLSVFFCWVPARAL